MNFYKIEQEAKDRIDHNINIGKGYSEQDDEYEFIQIYHQIVDSYNNQNPDKLEKNLYDLNFLISKKKIPIDSCYIFENLNIPNILLEVTFNIPGLPKKCIKDAFYSITYLLEYNNSENISKSQFYKISFQKSGILDFIIKNINSNINDSTLHAVSLLTSFTWGNSDFSPAFFDQIGLHISQFINSFYQFDKDANDKENEELRKSVTQLIYTLSFSIPSDDVAFFFYTYADFVLHMNNGNEEYPCDRTRILHILDNVACFKQSLNSIYNNQLIIKLLNKVFTSDVLQDIKVGMKIIKSLIDNNFDLTKQFSLYNFFELIYENDSYVVDIACEFIRSYLGSKPNSIELGLAMNVIEYFKVAYKNFGYQTKMQLVKTLCLIIKVGTTQNLTTIVKEKLVEILVDALDFDNDQIVIAVLESLCIIWKMKPVYDSNHINIALQVFDECEGSEKFRSLNYDDENVNKISKQFFELFENVLDINEADPSNF